MFALFSLQTVPLSFMFTFYGHEVKQITIATGGNCSLRQLITVQYAMAVSFIHCLHTYTRWTVDIN